MSSDNLDTTTSTTSTFECIHCRKGYKRDAWRIRHQAKCQEIHTENVINTNENNDDNDYIDFLLFHDSKDDDKNAIISRSINHIMNNFQLFGFSSITLSLIQSFKEMIENSIDAIKTTLNDKKEIWISINQYEDHDNLVQINVADTGTGMYNPLLLLSPFETTKVNNGQSSSNNFGRFGVGLSTAFVYSFKHTHCPMTVMTKTYDSKVTKKMNLGFELYSGAIVISDSVIFVQKEEISGTGIRMILPIMDRPSPIHSISAFADVNDKDTYDKDIMLPEMEKWRAQKDENVYEVIDAISDYLRRLDIMSVFGEHCEITIHLNIAVDGICYEREYTSKSELYETNSVISDINEDTYQIDHGTPLQDRSVSLCMRDLNLDDETKQNNIETDDNIIDDCNMSMSSLLHQSLEMSRIDITKKIELNIDQIYPNFDYCISDVAVSTTVDCTPNEAIEVAIVLFDKLPINNKENCCESIIYKGLKLSLWRYVNDTPLLDLFNDSISCMVSHALNQVQWSEFGHHCKYDLKKNSWFLTPVKESSDIALNVMNRYPAEVLMIVNIRSPNVNYANLRKTSLSHDKELTSSIVNCISEAMYTLRSTQSKLDGYDLFMSKIDRKQNAIRSYIPILSQSLAKIIYFSQNPSIHEEFMNSVINNEDEDRVDTLKKVNDSNFKKISAHLEELISNTYEKSS